MHSLIPARGREFILTLYPDCRPGQHSRYSKPLWAGRPGYRIQVEARFFTPIQIGPGAHPASYKMGTMSVPWVYQLGHGVDHPPSASDEVKERVELSTPLLHFTFTFTIPRLALWPTQNLRWALTRNKVYWMWITHVTFIRSWYY
jgi:hypothetical protein